MIRWICAACVLLSCGHNGTTSSTVPGDMLEGHGETAPPGGPTPGSDAPPLAPASTATLAPEAACTRFAVLAGQGCAWSGRFPPEFRDTAICVRSLETWFSPATSGHDRLERTVGCWAQDCDDAAACMVRVQSSAPPAAPRNCGDEGTSPIFVDNAAWTARRGANAKRFADVQTTVEQPIEVCGIEGEVEWITRVTCANGSNPIGTQERANDSRDSWMARGGHCNSILDRYSVTCPEATYVIHVDRYVCPLKPR